MFTAALLTQPSSTDAHFLNLVTSCGFRAMALLIAFACQDRLMLMGWPTSTVKWSLIPDRHVASLVGEALHLSCLGLVLYAAILSTDTWWSNKDVPKVPAGSTVVAAPEALQPKRRRTGAVGRQASMT